MTVTASAAASPAKRRSSTPAPRDCLVPFPEAERRLGRSLDTLRLWHDEGHMPTVVTPGAQCSTDESFIKTVLASARPKQTGSVEEIARSRFAARTPGVVA